MAEETKFVFYNPTVELIEDVSIDAIDLIALGVVLFLLSAFVGISVDIYFGLH